jgi:hypothetical protein
MVSTLRGNAEVLQGARQREAVGRDDADRRVDVDEAALVEVLGVDHRAVDVREDLELRRAADVVAVAAGAVADDALPSADTRTCRPKGSNAVLLGHRSSP